MLEHRVECQVERALSLIDSERRESDATAELVGIGIDRRIVVDILVAGGRIHCSAGAQLWNLVDEPPVNGFTTFVECGDFHFSSLRITLEYSKSKGHPSCKPTVTLSNARRSF